MRIVFTLLILSFFSLKGFANGKISGKITDEKTGEPLTGVTVAVRNMPVGAVTDIEGHYKIDVAPGMYVLQLNYIGYQGKNVEEVIVKEGQITVANAALGEGGKELQEVVVTATLKKETINALYTIQRNNVAVSSGISADLIRRSPDRNTGEVLKRVSGASVRDNKFVIIRGLSDRYNAAMINNAQMPSTEPDKKAFSFDVIPSDLIDNIIINKTASADMPGDFAGGVVQVLTKDIPDQDFANIGLGAGYNTQSTFRDFISNKRNRSDYLAFPNQQAKLPSAFGEDYRTYKALPPAERLGVARKLDNNYAEVRSKAMPNTSFQLATGKVLKMNNGGRFGTVAAVTYRNTQTILPDFVRGLYEQDRVSRYSKETQYRFNSTLAALVNFSYVKEKSKLSFKTLYNKLYDNTYYHREGYTTSNNQEFRLTSSVPNDRQILNSQLEGDHALGNRNVKLYWNLNYSNISVKQYDYRTAFYSRTTSFDEEDKPVAYTDVPYVLTDRNSRRFFSDMQDHNLGGNFNVRIPVDVAGRKQYVKVGYLGLYKNRDFNARFFQYRPYNNVLFDESISRQPLGTILSPDNLKENGYDLEDITLPTDKYKVNSMLQAGFVMLDNNISDRLRVSYGIRVESYTQQIDTRDLSGTDFTKKDVFTDYLPSLNLSYDMNDKTKLRLSGSRTVNRPEFREVALFNFMDFENNWTVIGNPALDRGRISNVDVRYEYYPSAGEMLSAGVFYKYFQTPIESQMDAQANLDLLIFGFQNAKAARSIGAEIDIRKSLSFISSAKWAERLTLGGNFTYIHSRVDLSNMALQGRTIQNRPLQGQSPYLINLSALYNDPATGLGFSVLYNRIGQRIFVVGNGSIPDTWENGRDVIDFQISKSVFKERGTLKLTIADLLGQPVLYYWNTDGVNTYKSGASLAGKGNDQIFQRYKPGTTLSVGFNYRL